MAKTANINMRIDEVLPFEMKQPRFNSETETAIEEARLIMAGKISAKRYSTVKELFDELKTDGE